MEFEIDDDPQGQPDELDGDRDGGIEEDLVALKNTSSAETKELRARDRQDRSLIRRTAGT